MTTYDATIAGLLAAEAEHDAIEAEAFARADASLVLQIEIWEEQVRLLAIGAAKGDRGRAEERLAALRRERRKLHWAHSFWRGAAYLVARWAGDAAGMEATR